MRNWWILLFYHVTTHKSGLILQAIPEIILTFSNIEPKAFIYNLPEPLKLSFIISAAISKAYWTTSYTTMFTTQDERARMWEPSEKVSCPNWQQYVVRQTWVHRQLGCLPAVWPRVSCFKLSEPWIPHLKQGAHHYLLGLWSGVNEITNTKRLASRSA